MTRVVWSGQVDGLAKLTEVLSRYGERNTVYIEITDTGLCHIDYAEETVEIHHDGYLDGYPLAMLGKNAFPALVVVVGIGPRYRG